MTSAPILQVISLSKYFKQGNNIICVLDNVDFVLAKGEVVALVGPSGCGKTTFLHIAGLLDLPDAGTVMIGGKDYTSTSDSKRTECRRHSIGFVYQSHNLLSDFTALDNALMPMKLRGIKDARTKAAELLSSLKLSDRLHHYPSQLSGGEQQRVAIARSLAHDPSIILADEPTGNLDSTNAQVVLKLLIANVKNLKKSMIIVTHNKAVAKQADRVVTISKGKLVRANV
jgi:lipoprotein-releasing system ATP-binding protein